MLKQIREFINDNKMLCQGDGIVVGLSGGADSVCLLHILHALKEEYKLKIIAVHVNHMIRGDEAVRDQEFSGEIAASLGIPIEIFRVNIEEMAKELHITTEEAGRKYRYEIFKKVLMDNNYNKIAVAHNKNDVAETVVFNLIRGSGLKGISGISPVRDNVIRPLLVVLRTEIEEYLRRRNINFCVDSTNLSDSYDRNKIRNNIFPNMNVINSKSIEHIYSMAQNAREYYEYVYQIASELLESHLKSKIIKNTCAYSIEFELLKSVPLIIQREAILIIIEKITKSRKDISKKHIIDILGLMESKSGKNLNMPYGVEVVSDYGELLFYKKTKEEKTEEIFLDLEVEEKIVIPLKNRVFSISKIASNDKEKKSQIFQSFNKDIEKKEYTKYVDYDKMLVKPCIRVPNADDYIIINMQGNKKKLSRLFIDMKITKIERETWPVIACGNEVVWAVGLRLGYNYKISDNTQNIIVLEYI